MKNYREITGSIIVAILLVATISACIVCVTASENTSDSDKAYYDLAGIMLNPSDSDKDIMMQWIDETELISDNEKTELKENLVGAWERFPDNTDEDLETAKLALDIAVDVAEKEKEGSAASKTSPSKSKTYSTQDEITGETQGERPSVDEEEVESAEKIPAEEDVADEEEATQSTAASPGFSALSLIFVISIILLKRNR